MTFPSGLSSTRRSTDSFFARVFGEAAIFTRRTIAVAVYPYVAFAGESTPPRALTFEGAYTAEVLSVATGGLQTGASSRGLLEAAVVVDLAAAGAPPATVFRCSALAPHGAAFSSKRAGDLLGASNIEAYDHPELYELWIAGKLDGGRVDVRAGRLLADTDFATTESGVAFLNSSFGWPTFISANTRNTGPAFYRSALGVYAAVHATERLLFHAGIYDGDSFDDINGDPMRYPNGLHTQLGAGQGTFLIAEMVLETTSGSGAAEKSGALKLGVWGHTADFADQFNSARTHAGTYGVYAGVEQTLWCEAGRSSDDEQGLRAFARAGFCPADRSLFSQACDIGLCRTGLFPGRDRDVLGLGVAWAWISNEARRAERAAGAAIISDYEGVIELSYQFIAAERWSIIPDFQWIIHPGGSSDLNNALVVGLRTRVEF